MMRFSILVFTAALAIPRAGFSLPLIHEVYYDAEGSDAAHVFTELSGAPGLILDGFRLVGIDGGSGLLYRSIDLTGASIPGDGLLVIATSQAIGELLAARDFIANVDWQNGPDAVQLWNPFGVVIDALQYGDAGRFDAGEGAFAPDPPAGFSLTRDLHSRDTGNNFSDFEVAAPTPGTGRTLVRAVSEPLSLQLLVLGVGALLANAAIPWGGRAASGSPRGHGRSRPS